MTIYDMITGATAAVPMPTTKRAASMKASDWAIAVRTLPRVNTAMPKSKVIRRPIISHSFPRIGAKVAVEIARASAAQVVLL